MKKHKMEIAALTLLLGVLCYAFYDSNIKGSEQEVVLSNELLSMREIKSKEDITMEMLSLPTEELLKQQDEKVKKERVSKIINLSKELEQDYFSKFIGKELVFIPEVYKNGYLIGHTGNYILVRALGDEKLLKQDINVKLEKLEYPYVLGCII